MREQDLSTRSHSRNLGGGQMKISPQTRSVFLLFRGNGLVARINCSIDILGSSVGVGVDKVSQAMQRYDENCGQPYLTSF